MVDDGTDGLMGLTGSRLTDGTGGASLLVGRDEGIEMQYFTCLNEGCDGVEEFDDELSELDGDQLDRTVICPHCGTEMTTTIMTTDYGTGANKIVESDEKEE